MAGLNPDGLGRNRAFDSTEQESLETEQESIKDPTDSVHKQDVRTIEETETHVDAQYRQFGDHPTGALPMRGTREIAMPLFFKDNFSQSFTSSGEQIEVIDLPPFYHTPNKIPFIVCECKVSNDTAGTDTGVQLRMLKRNGNAARGTETLLKMTQSADTGFSPMVSETYLADFVDHKPTSVKKSLPRLSLEGVLAGGTGNVERSKIMLGYEVR